MIDQRLAIENGGAGRDLTAGTVCDLGAHIGQVLETAREEADLVAVLVDLHPDPVVLVLNEDSTQPFHDGIRTGQASGKLRPDRMTHLDLQMPDRLDARLSQG